MVMSPPVDFVKRTLNQPIVSNSEEIQQQLNSQEEALPADTLGNDLPAQEVEEEKPKRKSRKKVEEKPVEADPDLENFKESTKRLSLQTVFNKMAQSEQKTIIVKEIKFEESFDFTGSMAQLQKTFQVELERKKQNLMLYILQKYQITNLIS